MGSRVSGVFVVGWLALMSSLPLQLASGQNLLANPDFETFVGQYPANWSNVSPATLGVVNYGWPDDLVATPGSMIFVNTSPNAGTGNLVHQCVQVAPNTRYLLALHARVPSGQNRTGQARIQVGGTATADCSTAGTFLGDASIDSTTTDVWLGESTTFVTGAGTAAVQATIIGTKNEAGGEFQVLVDAVYVGKPVKGDFNADGYADLVWDNLTSDVHRVWTMGGAVRESSLVVTPDQTGANLKLAVTDDFNDDARTDLVFRSDTNGNLRFWMMNGVERDSVVAVDGALPGSTLAAAADFNHDGKPDLLWRDPTNQALSVWTMDGTVQTGTLTPNPAQAVNANWAVVIAADLDRDGNTDLLWYNSTSGKIVRWLLDANLVRLSGGFTTPANAGNNNWKVVAAGEYKRVPGSGADGVDIVWRNETSGKLVTWMMDASSTKVVGGFTTPDTPNPALGWTVVGPR